MYSLKTIIAVGYRVNSERGIKFRIWATERLKEYIIKGIQIQYLLGDRDSNPDTQDQNLMSYH